MTDRRKTHLKVGGVDYRTGGQTEYEYNHQALCGFVRDNVTPDKSAVDCCHCLKQIEILSRFNHD